MKFFPSTEMNLHGHYYSTYQPNYDYFMHTYIYLQPNYNYLFILIFIFFSPDTFFHKI